MAPTRHPILRPPRPHITLNARYPSQRRGHDLVQTDLHAVLARLPPEFRFRVTEHVDIKDRGGDHGGGWLRRARAVSNVGC